jgi:hypothetical protein
MALKCSGKMIRGCSGFHASHLGSLFLLETVKTAFPRALFAVTEDFQSLGAKGWVE